MSDQGQASTSVPSPIANQASDSGSAGAASVAQTNVAGDGLKCEWKGCGDQLPSAHELYEHICERHVGRKSTNNLNLTCAWGTCQTTTVKRDHITSHIRVHVPLKPHKCDFCSKSFKRPQDLKKHVKTHAEDTGFQNSPEPSRNGHGGGAGGYGGAAKHGVADLQHMAATATGYYGEPHGIPGQPGVYPHYPNGNTNPSAYHGPTANYQANYATTFYPLPGPSAHALSDYEVRKRATFDALNEFFGDIKSRSLDSNQFHAVGQRLMNLQNLPSYVAGQEYGPSPAVATAAHQPLGQHYSLPLSHLRTKNDLQNIDQFLEQLQAQVYEHENPQSAAAAGVAQPGVHTLPVGLGYRSSHSPPHSSHVQTSSHALPPLTSTTQTETPALTPASSVVSYNSPGSVHSSAISPVSRGSVGGSIYPTLPSVSSVGEAIGSYAATSSALPSALGPSFDSDGRRRYSGGTLQKSVPDRAATASPDTLPQIARLGVRSPALSNVDPALTGDGDKTPRGRSPVDPAITASDEAAEKQERFLIKARVIESIREMIKDRLKNGEFDDSDDEEVQHEDETDREARKLYPVIRSLQES